MNLSAALRFPACLLTLLLLAPIPALKAQSYHPFPHGRSLEYAFTQPGSAETWFLAAAFDSIRVEGMDTAYYLYRIDRAPLATDTGTTCFGSSIHQLQRLLMSNRDHYLGQKMLVRPDGECLFATSAADSFSLQSQASVGATWSWAPGITATVDSIVGGSVLGVPDSLKYIHLSTGETWILSKAHGLVQCSNLLPFPSNTGSPLQIQLSLSAIPNLGLGHPLPGYAEIFDFDPGDKFGYEFYSNYHNGYETDFLEYNFQALVPGTRFHYQILKERFKIDHPSGAPIDSTYYPPIAATLIIDSNTYAHAMLHPYEHVPGIPNFFGQTMRAGAHTSSAMHGRIILEFLLMEAYDSCAQVLSADGAFGDQQFGEGLGEVHYSWWNVFTPSSRTLYCYQKGAESWGICKDLGNMTSSLPMLGSSLRIFPNPAQSMVKLEFQGELAAVQKSIGLASIDGRQVSLHDLPAGSNALDLALDAFPPGIYLIEVVADGFQVHRERLVIVR